MQRIRHLAVHRARVSTQLISSLAHDMQVLADILEDWSSAHFFRRVGEEGKRATGKFESLKKRLEDQLLEKLKPLAAQRAELDRQEQEAIDAMLVDEIQAKDNMAATLQRIWIIPDRENNGKQNEVAPGTQEKSLFARS